MILYAGFTNIVLKEVAKNLGSQKWLFQIAKFAALPVRTKDVIGEMYLACE